MMPHRAGMHQSSLVVLVIFVVLAGCVSAVRHEHLPNRVSAVIGAVFAKAIK